MRYACKHLFVTDSAVGVGAISVVAGKEYLIDRPCLSKTRDESHRVQIDQLQVFPKMTEVHAAPSLVSLENDIWTLHGNFLAPVYAVGSGGGTPYPWEGSGASTIEGTIDPSGIQTENIVAFLMAANASRVPVDTYLSVAIYSTGRKALVEALEDATFPLAVNGIPVNSVQELFMLDINPADIDSAPQIIIQFTDPTDARLFRRLPLAAEFSTIDNLQSSLRVPIIPDREILLLVPEAKPRYSQVAPKVTFVQEMSPETLLDDMQAAILQFLSEMASVDGENNFRVRNVEGILNCNIRLRGSAK